MQSRGTMAAGHAQDRTEGAGRAYKGISGHSAGQAIKGRERAHRRGKKGEEHLNKSMMHKRI